MFKDVVGQTEAKRILLSQVKAGRLPHALLLSGETGFGTLALALALANYVLCHNRGETDSCGECSACVKMKKLIHADLHFSFPIIKKGSGDTTADAYMQQWISQLKDDPYFDLNDWTSLISDGKKQAVIPDAECDNVIKKMSLTSYEGGKKVMIMWLPEKMTNNAANTLLKTLEEPSKNSLFILCSEHPELLLTTIVSRTQRIEVPPINLEDLTQALMDRRGLGRDTAMSVARTSGGSYLRALRQLCDTDEANRLLQNFIQLMRLAYVRNLPALMQWSDHMAALNREQQQTALAYMQGLLRENFVYNFHHSELNFMTPQESAFASKFARFINERNIIKFANEFARAQKDVAGNVNGRTIFFNLALRTIILLRA